MSMSEYPKKPQQTGQINVTKAFLKSFAELANRYDWNADEIEEMKNAVRENNGMKEWLEKLASAHRRGYEQTKENNYIRVDAWLRCAEK